MESERSLFTSAGFKLWGTIFSTKHGPALVHYLEPIMSCTPIQLLITNNRTGSDSLQRCHYFYMHEQFVKVRLINRCHA